MRHSRLLQTTIVIVYLISLCQLAHSWTSPVQLSDPNHDAQTPRIARSAGGGVHLAWRLRYQPWWIGVRSRDALGNWTSLEYISNKYYVDQPDIIEDALGRVHVFYCGGDGTPYDYYMTDIYEAIKDNGAWNYAKLTGTTDNRAYPRAAIDSNGNIHLVHIKWNLKSTGVRGNVMYRLQTSSGWTDDVNIGSIYEVYYHHADISVDTAGNVYVAWVDSGSPKHSLKFRRKSANGTWSSTLTLGANDAITNSSFFYPKVAWAGGNNVLAAVDETSPSQSLIRWAQSTDGGTTWISLATNLPGSNPSFDTDPALNGAHLVYTYGTTALGHRKWTQTFGMSDHIQISSPTYSQLMPDIAIDTSGNMHVAFENNIYNSGKNLISHITGSPDTTPCGPVSQLAATPSDGATFLKWTNPTDADFTGAMVRVKLGSAPTSISDGTFVANVSASPGSTSSYSHAGLTNGLTYYYTVFAHDSYYNHATGMSVSATPFQIAVNQAKTLADGTFVQLHGKVVSASFSSAGYIYVQEPSGVGGIRVATSTAYSTGAVVNVSGTLSSIMSSTLTSEKMISGATIAPTGGTLPVASFAMNNRDLGGTSISPTFPGVVNGKGPNTIGMLVTIYGRVRYVSGNYMYIDDGSGVTAFNDETGVLVYKQATLSAGDYVRVVGINQGSIPVGWSSSQRFIRCRTSADIIKY